MRQHFGKRDWILLGVLAIIAIAIWGYTSFGKRKVQKKPLSRWMVKPMVLMI